MRLLLLFAACAAASGTSGDDRRSDLGLFAAGDDLGGTLGTVDLRAPADLLTANATDLAATDLAATDLSAPPDLSPLRDLSPPPPDLLPAPVLVQHVHILIDNQCHTSTSPTEITSPLHQPLEVEYHNHSVDYSADVWLSYIGGFLDLGTGQTWHDKVQHCMNPVPYDAYADVSINGGGTSACPKFRMMIHCK